MNLYVYYDVSVADASALAREVRAMQLGLREISGIASRLMKRPSTGNGRETWMEIYEGVGETFEPELARAASTVDWRGAGPRQVERFVDL